MNMKFRRRVGPSDTLKNQQHIDVAEVTGTREITFKKTVGGKKGTKNKPLEEYQQIKQEQRKLRRNTWRNKRKP